MVRQKKRRREGTDTEPALVKALRQENEDLRERLAAAEASLELATSSLAAKATKFVQSLFFKESPTAKEAAPVIEDKDPRAQNKDLRSENQDLRERVAARDTTIEVRLVFIIAEAGGEHY